MTRILFVLFLTAASIVFPARGAEAQSEEVVALFERGLAAYRLAQYEEAERLFAEAHAIEALPDLSYNHARTLELLGRFGEAADVYERFLREAPETEDREVIEARIQNLRERAVQSAPDPVDDPPPVEIVVPPETSSPERNVAGPLVVLSGGLVLAAVGVGTGVAATRAHDTAVNPSTNQPDTDDANKRAARLARTTNALFVLGGVAFAAGTTWLVVELLGGSQGEEVSVELSPTGVLVHGRF